MPPSASADLSTRKTSVLFRMSTLSVNSDDDSTRSRPTQRRGTAIAPNEKLMPRSIPDKKKRVRETHVSTTRVIDTSDITMLRHPIYTLQYFGMAVRASLPSQWPWSSVKTSVVTLLLSVVLALHQEGKRGVFNMGDSTSIQSMCVWLEDVVLETLFWIGCGVLSTIGLGSGLQTGALFLFPHVCRLSLAWSKLHNHSNDAPSLAALLWSVAIPGFWSGTGSAAGELVPFLLARLIRKSGKDPFALFHDPTPTSRLLDKEETSSTISSAESQESCSITDSSANSIADDADPSNVTRKPSWTSQLLLSNTRAAMENQLSSNAFWKIFALAVVPNALFDLAGLVCGASSDVSVWEFFLATWLAKAIVRTPLQTCGLALAVVAIVSPTALRVGGDLAVHIVQSNEVVSHPSSSTNLITEFLERWGSAALSQFIGNEGMGGIHHDQGSTGNGGDDPSISNFLDFVKMIWSLITAGLFLFFIVSTIEQIAQHHARSLSPVEKCKENCNDIISKAIK